MWFLFTGLKVILIVLIDTWWNVNRITEVRYLRTSSCFNRYMVECEYSQKVRHRTLIPGFNRYMVECEYK